MMRGMIMMTNSDRLAISRFDLSSKLFNTGLALAVVATFADVSLMFLLFFFSALFFILSLWFSHKAVQEFIDQSKAKKVERQWVSVEERLPEKDGKYLVQVPTMDKDKPYIGVAWYDPSFGWSLLPEPFIKAITRWMALPDSPLEAGAIYQDC
jgi:hypothetical protein